MIINILKERERQQELKELLREYHLEHYYEAIKPLVRPQINIDLKPAEESKIGIGNSRIGGMPDLPPAVAWPVNELGDSLSFIAQLNCEELAPHDATGLLPDSGLISFFYCANQEAWGLRIDDDNRFKVLYTPDTTALRKRDFPADLETHARYKPNLLTFRRAFGFPSYGDRASAPLQLRDEDVDNYLDLSKQTDNRVLGYPAVIQNSMEPECQEMYYKKYCQLTNGHITTKDEMRKGKEDWILLLQVDSEEDDTGMMWGDYGRIYYWIRVQELLQRDFSKSWFILESC